MEPTVIGTILLGTILGTGGLQEPQPVNYGCETYQVEGTNYFNFVDPLCPPETTGDGPVMVEEAEPEVEVNPDTH